MLDHFYGRGNLSEYGLNTARFRHPADTYPVIPAKAGTQNFRWTDWVPAFAGMTMINEMCRNFYCSNSEIIALA